MAFRDHGSLCICEECGAVFPNRGGCHRCRHTCDGSPIYKISPAVTNGGPGTELHKLINRLTGEDVSSACACKQRIKIMDWQGIAWCRENVDMIVDWLEEEIDKRYKIENNSNWRIKLATWKLPGQRLAMKQMILFACTLADRKNKIKK